MKNHSNIQSLFLILIFFIQTGCAVLFGNIRPITYRSKNYEVLDLKSKGWEKLTQKSDSSENTDLAFRSPQNNSVISINSSCRPIYKDQKRNLKTYADQLLVGFILNSPRIEREKIVANQPAYETEVSGTLKDEKNLIRMRVIIFRYDTCLYDILYLSSFSEFERQETDFEEFVRSLMIR